jgi:hypothetical protein
MSNANPSVAISLGGVKAVTGGTLNLSLFKVQTIVQVAIGIFLASSILVASVVGVAVLGFTSAYRLIFFFFLK